MRPARGFTLVEVLVALFVMALMAAIAWQGVDGVLRSRDSGRDSVDRTMRLATVMSQWQTDLQAVHHDAGVPESLAFDGRALRLVRRAEGGVQLVLWLQDGGRLQRWASPVTTRVADLQQAWLQSQQAPGGTTGILTLLEGTTGWQLTCMRAGSESNCQSSGDLVATAAAAGASAPAAARTEAPGGLRLVLQFGDKSLRRDVAVAPAL